MVGDKSGREKQQSHCEEGGKGRSDSASSPDDWALLYRKLAKEKLSKVRIFPIEGRHLALCMVEIPSMHTGIGKQPCFHF